MTKPLNRKFNTSTRLPAVIAASTVWKTEARKRNMDVDDKCKAKSRINWKKNLKTHQNIKVQSESKISCTYRIPTL